jgi:hypothetical protein
MSMTVYRQIGALREILSSEPVQILIRTPLPRTKTFGEVDLQIEGRGHAEISRCKYISVPKSHVNVLRIRFGGLAKALMTAFFTDSAV